MFILLQLRAHILDDANAKQTRPTLELSEVPPPSVLWGNLPNPADGQLSGLPFKCEGPPSPKRASKWLSLGHGVSLFFWDSVPEDDEEEGNQEWRDSGGIGGGRSGGGGGGGSLWGGGGAGRGLSCFLDIPGEDYRGVNKMEYWLQQAITWRSGRYLSPTSCEWSRVILAFTPAGTNLWGAGRTGRWGPHGALLDEIKPRRDRRKAEVLHGVAQLSSMGFPMLTDRGRAGRHHGRVLLLSTVLTKREISSGEAAYQFIK